MVIRISVVFGTLSDYIRLSCITNINIKSLLKIKKKKTASITIIIKLNYHSLANVFMLIVAIKITILTQIKIFNPIQNWILDSIIDWISYYQHHSTIYSYQYFDNDSFPS